MHTFRCRLVRVIDGLPQTVMYIGPFGAWAPGWSMVMRSAAIPRAA
jgi:hypothetical protein